MMNNLLLEKLRTGDASEEEFEQLESYFSNEKSLQSFEEVLAKDWKNTPAHTIEQAVSSKIWHELESSLEVTAKKFKLNPTYTRWAVGFVILLILAFLLRWLFNSDVPVASKIVELKNDTPSIQAYQIGSDIEVWLAGNSIVKYRKPFHRKVREIWVDGEAYFEAKGENERTWPFKIDFEGISVKLLSNHFNVEAIRGRPFYKFGVFQGQAFLKPEKPFNSDAEGAQVNEGQLAIYRKENNSLKSKPLEEDQVLAWKNGSIGYDGDPLEMVIKDLEQLLGKPFKYNKRSVANCEVFVHFQKDETPNKILRKVFHPNKIWFKERNGTYILTGKGCP